MPLPNLTDSHGRPLPLAQVFRLNFAANTCQSAKISAASQTEEKASVGVYDYDVRKAQFRNDVESYTARCKQQLELGQERKLAAFMEVLLNEPVGSARTESTAVLNPLRGVDVTNMRTRKYEMDVAWTRAAADPPLRNLTPEVAFSLPKDRHQPLEQAAARFDQSFAGKLRTAGRLVRATDQSPDSERKIVATRRATKEVLRNRFRPPEVAPAVVSAPTAPPEVASTSEAPLAKWSLLTSIWAPRSGWCDSLSFYESSEVKLRRFLSVWQQALSIGVGRFILTHDDGSGENYSGATSCPTDEVEEVEAVLWEYQECIFALFDTYTSLGTNLISMTFSQWCEVCKDFKFASTKLKHCNSVDLESFFLAIAKQGESLGRSFHQQAPDGPQDRKKCLPVSGFLYALVRVAVARYILSGDETDVSQAVRNFFDAKLLPRVGTFLTSGVDAYREHFIYTEAVDSTLRRHEPSLRNLFKAIARQDLQMGEELPDALEELVRYDDWGLLVRSLGLIGSDVSDRDANLCFVVARTLTVEPLTPRGARLVNGIPFESFLEAICRLAAIKGLPFTDDIIAAGFVDAGAYMAHLAQRNPEAYDKILRNCGSWGSLSPQPLATCVDHLLSIIVRAIEADSVGADDLHLTNEEVSSWWRAVIEGQRKADV